MTMPPEHGGWGAPGSPTPGPPEPGSQPPAAEPGSHGPQDAPAWPPQGPQGWTPQGPPGWQPPQPQGWGPPQQPRRTNWAIVAAISSVIILVVAVTVVIALNATGDDDPTTTATGDSTSTTDATTTTEPTTTSTIQPPDTDFPGEEFTDPEGVYLMNVNPEWVSNPGGLQGMEIWMVGQASGDRSNLNLLTALDGGGDLDTYMDGMLRGVGATTDNVNEVGRQVIEGAVGQELGLLELTGTQANQDLHFLIAVIMDGRTVVVATLTSIPETFADTRAAVEPYLLTLRFSE